DAMSGSAMGTWHSLCPTVRDLVHRRASAGRMRRASRGRSYNAGADTCRNRRATGGSLQMRRTQFGLITVLTVLVVMLASRADIAAGQAPSRAIPAAAAEGKQTALRTPWGDPDLQGTWTITPPTPLERPSELAGKQVLPAEERAALDAARARAGDRPTRRPGDTGAYNAFWGEAGTASAQTSLIVDPPDGKLPPL